MAESHFCFFAKEDKNVAICYMCAVTCKLNWTVSSEDYSEVRLENRNCVREVGAVPKQGKTVLVVAFPLVDQLESLKIHVKFYNFLLKCRQLVCMKSREKFRFLSG
jgi:hypothetical protein